LIKRREQIRQEQNHQERDGQRAQQPKDQATRLSALNPAFNRGRRFSLG
jgi:hypothetical protein